MFLDNYTIKRFQLIFSSYKPNGNGAKLQKPPLLNIQFILLYTIFRCFFWRINFWQCSIYQRCKSKRDTIQGTSTKRNLDFVNAVDFNWWTTFFSKDFRNITTFKVEEISFFFERSVLPVRLHQGVSSISFQNVYIFQPLIPNQCPQNI